MGLRMNGMGGKKWGALGRVVVWEWIRESVCASVVVVGEREGGKCCVREDLVEGDRWRASVQQERVRVRERAA